MTAHTFNDDIKTFGNANGGRYLQGRAGFRNASDCAFDLGRFGA
jgi:hypothetical protein